MCHLPYDDARSIVHNENESFKDSNNSGNYVPRRILEEGKLRAVQCRLSLLTDLILEPDPFSQGKYEGKKRRKELKLAEGHPDIYVPSQGGELPHNQPGGRILQVARLPGNRDPLAPYQRPKQ